MGWHGYTGAAGWLFRQALEGVFGLKLQSNQMIHPRHEERASTLKSAEVTRDLDRSLSEVVVAGSHMKSHRGGY
jgi:cyclic beta-1,2-glucan synthetase